MNRLSDLFHEDQSPEHLKACYPLCHGDCKFSQKQKRKPEEPMTPKFKVGDIVAINGIHNGAGTLIVVTIHYSHSTNECTYRLMRLTPYAVTEVDQIPESVLHKI